MARLRRFRWLATLLIAVSPAFGGQALPLLHPCPVDAPWLAAQHAVHHGMQMPAHADNGPTSHESHQHSCSCVGACATPAIVTAPEPSVANVAVLLEPQHRSWPVIEALDQRSPLVNRLPPSTAPPRT